MMTITGVVDLTRSIDLTEWDNEAENMKIAVAISDDFMELKAYHDNEYGWQNVVGRSKSDIYHPVIFELRQPTVTFKGIEITKAEYDELRKEFQ